MLETRPMPVKDLKTHHRNPRRGNTEQIEKSLTTNGQYRAIVVNKGTHTGRPLEVLAGNHTLKAARNLGWETITAHIIDVDDDQATRIVLADNRTSDLGKYDTEALAELLDDIADLDGTGYEEDDLHAITELIDNGETETGSYEDFLEKFEPPKTTDDCYTPDHIFEAVQQWATDEYDLQGITLIRPFFPGGDYENHDYPPGSVVLDNPPFSILAKITQFYNANGIKYFLYGNSLTGMNRHESARLFTGTAIVYDNGANVSTCFLTNLEPTNTARAVPELGYIIRKAIAEAATELPKPTIDWPRNLITGTMLQELARHGQALTIDAGHVRHKVGDEQTRRDIFGTGTLVSDATATAYENAKKAGEDYTDPFSRTRPTLTVRLSPEETEAVNALNTGTPKQGN